MQKRTEWKIWHVSKVPSLQTSYIKVANKVVMHTYEQYYSTYLL